MSDSKGPEPSPAPEVKPAPPAPVVPKPAAPDRRRLLLIGLGILIVAALLFWGIPALIRSFTTLSTDDAYVNGHVTFVAPRVAGQVAKVLVDDNNRVRRGDLLIQLDKEPYELMVEVKQAALEAAKADMVAAQASVRGDVAHARSQRFNLERTMEDVDNQVGLLRARVAALAQAKATLFLAQTEFTRAEELFNKKVVSKQEYDQRQQALSVAQAQVNQAMENVSQSRVALGLPADPANGADLTQVPPDLNQTFSSVRQAEAQLIQGAVRLGFVPSSYDLPPKQAIEEFLKQDPERNLDRIYASLIKTAPAIKQAEAKVLQAQRDLDQAELNLRYCDIVAEIDGVITRRNVNPGNNVQVGQSLMAIRSLNEIWVDANFKETQLARLRIGQPVDIHVDMYGKNHVFKGRVSGFTMGTGSTLALLPAQNATGNFIKVVQRLPVRIDLVGYDPDKDPLFVGLSVVPFIHFKEQPTGENAGKILQPDLPAPSPAKP